MLDIEALQAINRDVMRGHTQLSIISTNKKTFSDMVNVSTIYFYYYYFFVVKSAFSILIFICGIKTCLHKFSPLKRTQG